MLTPMSFSFSSLPETVMTVISCIRTTLLASLTFVLPLMSTLPDKLNLAPENKRTPPPVDVALFPGDAF